VSFETPSTSQPQPQPSHTWHVTFNPVVTDLEDTGCCHHLDSDDPFIAPQGPSSEAEAFNLSAISSALLESEPHVDPILPPPINPPMDSLPPSPSHQQLRVNKRASRPAGNRKAHLATDVYTFFEDDNESNTRRCKLCL
jgi:hypothetical protein